MLRVGPALTITRPSVEDFPSFDVLDQVGRAVHLDIIGLTGVDTIGRFFTVLDYGRDRVLAYPYAAPHPLFEDAFVGFGFVPTSTTGVQLSVTVVPGSDAQRKGLRTGDVFVGADGDVQITPAGIISGTIGQVRQFQFQRQGMSFTLSIVAQDLLPP